MYTSTSIGTDFNYCFLEAGSSINNSGDGLAQKLMPVGIALAWDGLEGAARVAQAGNEGVKAAALRLNLPTNAIDDVMNSTGKVMNGAKWAGRSIIVVGSLVSVYQGVDAYSNGDMNGAAMAGLDLVVGLGTAAIGGPVGVGVYIVYMMVMAPPPGGPSYQINGFVNDNTYVALPVVLPLKH